jgi:hypothetical protein
MREIVAQDGDRLFRVDLDQLKRNEFRDEWVSMPDDKGESDLEHLEDLAVDLVGRYPDHKAAVINYLRQTADVLEQGVLNDTIQEQARINGKVWSR